MKTRKVDGKEYLILAEVLKDENGDVVLYKCSFPELTDTIQAGLQCFIFGKQALENASVDKKKKMSLRKYILHILDGLGIK